MASSRRSLGLLVVLALLLTAGVGLLVRELTRPAVLVVEARPLEATIAVEDAVGVGQLTVHREPGPVEVRVTAPGHRPVVLTVPLTRGAEVRLTPELQPLSGGGAP
jgi:hypothetical protein